MQHVTRLIFITTLAIGCAVFTAAILSKIPLEVCFKIPMGFGVAFGFGALIASLGVDL